MKTKTAVLFMLVLMQLCAAAHAQEYVSIAELYDQAQAMGGVWRETFDTPNGEMTVDAPLIVPDVEAMPVLTVEQAKISEELFDQIRQGKQVGGKGEHSYEAELDGKTVGFFLGRDNDYAFGKQTDRTGYDAIQCLWMYHEGYLISRNTGMGTAEKRAQPTTYHFPWELAPDAACVRNTEITLDEAMRLWHEDIALCYPDEKFTIRPTRIMLRGSLMETDSKERNNRDGYLVIEEAEQLIGGVPLMGVISNWDFAIPYRATQKEHRIVDSLNPYRVGSYAVTDNGGHFYGNFTDTENYRTSSTLVRTRTVKYEDVPLAPLESVLEGVRKEIERGIIRRVHSVELGYLLYSNPDMTDYAWTIPRWKVEADYVPKGDGKDYEHRQKLYADEPLWARVYYVKLPVDAQSGEMILITTGDEETFSVPEIVTWDDIE